MEFAGDVSGWAAAIEWFAAMGLLVILLAWQPKDTHFSKARCQCRLCRLARAAGVPSVRGVSSAEEFAAAFRDALADATLSSVVAKVEATGPASFHMDLQLLENRFRFARWLRET